MKINLNKYIYLITYKGRIYKLIQPDNGMDWQDIAGNRPLGIHGLPMPYPTYEEGVYKWCKEKGIKITPIPIGGLDSLVAYINKTLEPQKLKESGRRRWSRYNS